MAVLPLRHFSPVEFRCKCGCGAGMEKMDADLLQMLDEARDLAGIPFPLSSAYRCPKHNRAVGGVPPQRTLAAMPWISAAWIPIPVSSCCKPCLRPDFGASSWLRRGFMWTTTRTSRVTWRSTSMEASTDGSDRD